MTGRTVVITGAGRGLGLITARELAGAGAHVVLGVRGTQRARRAVADLPGIFDVRRSMSRSSAPCAPAPRHGPATSTS
ncbi:SDR family NAD(P)-dependent oxidoreductase [Nocardia elegans]|uniref:SDR family NAD(P)-dependent oxidoreductase n=1 Tax=Nocardia elegans TaxID=300029 RepID=A0ABW6TL94_9NOCA